ncbi:polysaccharide biosynthesis tyrosine autokinase [Tumebacillus permanentifrigoris]|uniref:non-specific protein-tyrosine kinase n=1 Tax=Tumebacillus permanentifrigoris TaxID=378543 RepID=A0A316D9X8_9BACL|nr:polysaccharide biosynthesis tyrosine autokinase [Tumebacillus permanentifrigoris]PWK13759.1 capsular exopolysaccharide synthesis family protein [Tumebacillus permanentifrigoris]
MKFLLLKYFKAIQKRLWLIVLLIIFAVGTSYGVTKYTVTPQYRATTKLIVNLKPTEDVEAFLSDVMAYPKLMKTYNELIKSYTVTSAVVARLGLKMTPEELGASVTITSINESQIIAIQVLDTDDKRVTQLADEMAYTFIDKLEHIMQADNVFVLDKAAGRTPTKLKPNLKMNLAMAVVLSTLAGVGGVVLREYLDSTLKMREEVKAALNLVMVGEISVWGPRKKRFAWVRKLSFKRLLLGWNGGDGRNPKAYQQAAASLEHSMLRAVPTKQNRRILEDYQTLYRNLVPLSVLQEIKTLAITSTVRQEGKTTVLTHFAVLLAQSGQRVLLIDADVEHPTLHFMLRIPNDIGLGDCLTGRVGVQTAIHDTRTQNLDLLPIGNMTQAGVRALGTQPFELLLQEVREKYDIVLIDTPALGESLVPQVVTPRADGVLFLVGSGTVDRDQALLALDALRAAEANVIGAVLNNFEGKMEKSPFFLERIDNQIKLSQ